MYNKMPSEIFLLDASSSSNPKEFTLKDIEVLVNSKEQSWFKQARLGQHLGSLYHYIDYQGEKDLNSLVFLL